MRRHYERPLKGSVRDILMAEGLLGLDPNGTLQETRQPRPHRSPPPPRRQQVLPVVRRGCDTRAASSKSFASRGLRTPERTAPPAENLPLQRGDRSH